MSAILRSEFDPNKHVTVAPKGSQFHLVYYCNL